MGRSCRDDDFKTFQWEIRNRLAAFLLQDGVFTPLSDNSRSMSGPAIRMARCGESWWTMREIRQLTPPFWPSGVVSWTVPTDHLFCCWTAVAK